jgi:YidC/Oxa1 family membrane protein insertase
MKSEYRGLVAIILSAVVFVLWYVVFAPQTKPAAAPEEKAVAEQTAIEEKKPVDLAQEAPLPEATDQIIDPQAGIPLQTAVLENELLRAEFTNAGAVPLTWQLKNYKRQIETAPDKKETRPVDMASAEDQVSPALQLTFQNADFQMPEKARYQLIKSTGQELIYQWASPEAVVTKSISLPSNSYLASVTVTVKNKTGRPLNERPALSWGGVYLPSKSKGLLSIFKQPPAANKNPVYFLDGSVERQRNVAKVPAAEDFTGNIYWSGLEDRYFLSAIIPRDQSSQTTAEIGAADLEGIKGGRTVRAGAALASTAIAPGDQVTHNFSVYSGPKEINQLKAVGVRLEESIDYGWFTIIAIPILYLLKFFHHIVGNYGIAIIILTIFIKLLLHPINRKSLKSMKQMQKLQPRLKELQKKFSGDKARLNAETMQLFKSNKVNPMGGCLPMLLQFPIYIALYKVLWSSIELYRAPFFWFYKDLSAPDPYYITPILLGVGMVLQQKLMPSTSADPAQQKMMMIMPIMFAVFMFFLPVGLVIYILVNTAMSVTQQWMYNNDIHFRDLLRGKFKPVKA